jgi:hypothetical protein
VGETEASPDVSDVSALLARADQLDAVATKARDSVQSVAPNRDDFDRSVIARVIMCVYAGVVAAEFVFLATSVVADKSHWDEAKKDAVDLVKTAVLPIVTLVLGYYFGKSGRS